MMITRVGFCPKCFQKAQPKIGNHFIVFGATSKSLIGMLTVRNGMKGMTPHIYEVQRVVGKVIYYQKICCMVGCGAYLTKVKDKLYVYLDETCYEDEYTSCSNWNALCTFKDPTFQV